MEEKYTTICNTIITYLIDEDIIINENDTNLNKISLFLLRYKRSLSMPLVFKWRIKTTTPTKRHNIKTTLIPYLTIRYLS